MKKLFAALLVLNLLFELLAASSLIAGPEGIRATGLGNQWSMHYGFAALAIASVSVWAWPGRQLMVVATPVLGILLTFHTGLFISLMVAGDQVAGSVIHAVLALLAWALFLTRKKWCVESEAGRPADEVN
jgi:hypothetical protein